FLLIQFSSTTAVHVASYTARFRSSRPSKPCGTARAAASTSIWTMATMSSTATLPVVARHKEKTMAERPQYVTLGVAEELFAAPVDRKSTRLNSSHVKMSYAVLCLK